MKQHLSLQDSQEMAEENLFFSAIFRERLQRVLGSPETPFRITRLRGLRIASQSHDFLLDYENWPLASFSNATVGGDLKGRADWLVFRKLILSNAPPSYPKNAWIKPYSLSPYLLLSTSSTTRPLLIKEHSVKLERTKRKLIREIGAPSLSVLDGESEKERAIWFNTWISFQQRTRMLKGQSCLLDDPSILRAYQSWIVSSETPSWMKLFQFTAGKRVLAVGLFYVWKKRFYYYGPANSPEDDLRKYGVGIQFTQSLIDWAYAHGIEVFDFMQGAHPYKLRWQPYALTPLHQCIIPISIRGQIALHALKARTWLQDHMPRLSSPTKIRSEDHTGSPHD